MFSCNLNIKSCTIVCFYSMVICPTFSWFYWISPKFLIWFLSNKNSVFMWLRLTIMYYSMLWIHGDVPNFLTILMKVEILHVKHVLVLKHATSYSINYNSLLYKLHVYYINKLNHQITSINLIWWIVQLNA